MPILKEGNNSMIFVDNLILGAGISGLACGEHLRTLGLDYLLLEKNPTYGGLCDSYSIEGFRFDKFVHLSFSNIDLVREYFDKVAYEIHRPNPENYYYGTWIKHPAQNNLFPLAKGEKEKILHDMKYREKYEGKYFDNYENWLRYQFGDYFAEHFSMVYTRKYWGCEAKELETKWIGNRIYRPTMDEILKGMETSDTPITYYAKEMRYPKKGGFKSYLSTFVDINRIRFDEEVKKIDTVNHLIITNKNEYRYKKLYSSIPLPEYEHILELSESVKRSIEKLYWTSGYTVSLGMKGKLYKKNIWDYVYDENIYTARIYSPSEESADNAPEGCCSLQAEIYIKNTKDFDIGENELLEKTIDQLDSARIIDKTQVLIKDIRFEKFANIIFDKNIYENRSIIKKFLVEQGIITIGRFGEWDYFWSDQSFMSGWNSVNFLETCGNER